MKLNNFYKNKKILITGNTGFKGSWLNYILKDFGAEVYGYALKPKNKFDNYNLLKLNSKNNIYADIRDFKKLKKFIEKVRPEMVFHLSAQALVKTSYVDPLNTFSTNIMGVANILEILKSSKFVKSIVIVTSDKCYKDEGKKMGYSEKDRIGGLDPYSASKAGAENVFYSYLNSIFVNKVKKVGLASVRAGNVIGGGDWSDDRIIPDFIKSVLDKKSFYVRSPNAVRPWQHVFDLLNGYVILGKNLYEKPNRFSGSWNFGPNKNRNNKVIEIIKTLSNFLNIKKKIVIKEEKNIKETYYLHLKSDKSKKILKWKPKLNLKSSLKLTAEWYHCFLNKKDLNKISKKQVKNYFYD